MSETVSSCPCIFGLGGIFVITRLTIAEEPDPGNEIFLGRRLAVGVGEQRRSLFEELKRILRELEPTALLLQYFPKGNDLSIYSQAELKKVARQLNEQPRKTLEFETPTERFNACVASTG